MISGVAGPREGRVAGRGAVRDAQGAKEDLVRRWFRGVDWPAVRGAAIARGGGTCARCGASGPRLAVHHVVPFATFASAAEANVAANLMVVCARCHPVVEAEARRAAGLPAP